jgi:DNA-directed RNA polymerase subunit RPC12/RpoP
MVKRTISCPSCGENIVIKEKKESVIDFNIEMAKRMWAE